ncbi:TPA: N-acetyltransferase [Candidatus Poribacteria bacterium]|nr:N-acetyltransferase [Candidatus Poribacteria bacterium]HIA66945.1 N-acetyltransferase [Candidatus Poribacteria bacterium]HIB86946.1 N-acetyltransferase [Candidatus Poribacteria bacterium]HIB99458.1 N-acetyltransferase [Candidatus Poribacteria bacterium]HIC18184.1 N-acetyltransferase [Candidatus Poribacteria bacterium]
MDLPNSHHLDLLQPWLDNQLGTSIDSASADPVSVYSTPPRQKDQSGLWAIRVGEKGVITTRLEWLNALKLSIADLSAGQLFSTFGAYELSRITLADGVGVWGPSWLLVGDSGSFQPVSDDRPIQLEADEISRHADPDLFWHCFPDQVISGFAIFEVGQLVALASVSLVSNEIWEIGIDVVPKAKGRGLGRAVVSAAGQWTLSHSRLIYATTAAWNVPSARLLRSVGLKYVASIMTGIAGPFRVPPQPLGYPCRGVDIYNYYPDWAMNKGILSASGLD